MIENRPNNENKIFSSNLNRIGNTPIVKIEENKIKGLELFMKLEGENPTGSIKDRTALGIIKNEMIKGNLIKGKTLLDASSGSYGCSISYIGNLLGFPVQVVCGSKLTKDKENFIKYFGAELLFHGDYTIEGNLYCRKIHEQTPEKYCFLDQLHNFKNPEIHYKTTGPEILDSLPDISAIAFSLGSGGTLNGIAKYVKETKPNIKLIGVTAASGAKIPGTGAFVDGDYITPFIQELYDRNLLDYITEVSTNYAIKGVKYLRSKGFYVGIQTGAVYQGMINGIHDRQITGKILMISGDSGWKNSDKLINIDKI